MNYTLEELNAKVEQANELGGSLDLSGLTSIPEGFNPTVGDWLYLSGGLRCKVNKLKNGDMVEGRYIYCDDMLVHIKRKKQFGEYTYYVGKIKGMNVIYDGKNYAHCKSFKEGLHDLAFKTAKDRGADQYKSYTMDSVVTVEEAKTMYRIITGACKAGTDHFVNNVPNKKRKYTVRELIDITEGQYRADVFKKFFTKE